ncbi:MAG: hypothetical protein IPO50_08470 [Sphingomonadales bacterium]|nr:hypothetical protein [Sphingomonadales bacterium]
MLASFPAPWVTEHAQQFAAAIKVDVGVKKNDPAIAALKRSFLTGARSSQ